MAEHRELTGESGFTVRVVTPQGIVAETKTDAVTGPGRLGEFEVLPGHVPFLTELYPGVLVLGEKSREYLAVAGGYLKVGEHGDIEVLVEKAVPGAKVDTAAAQASLDEVGERVDTWSGALDAEYRTLRGVRDWAQAQLDAHARAGN